MAESDGRLELLEAEMARLRAERDREREAVEKGFYEPPKVKVDSSGNVLNAGVFREQQHRQEIARQKRAEAFNEHGRLYEAKLAANAAKIGKVRADLQALSVRQRKEVQRHAEAMKACTAEWTRLNAKLTDLEAPPTDTEWARASAVRARVVRPAIAA